MNKEEAWDRWAAAGPSHSSVMIGYTNQMDRLRMLATAPLFSLWTDCKLELSWAADEIERLQRQCAMERSELNEAKEEAQRLRIALSEIGSSG